MSANLAIVGDEFKRGFRRQTQWSWSMASAFFFGESGAGLFLVSLLLDFFPGLVVGLLLTAVGKTTGHLLHLGRPARAWRAILKLKNSWVSRGLLAIIVFTGCAALYVLHLAGLDFGVLPRSFALLLGALAGVAAIVIMLYQGLAMSHSPAIALWSTGIMPMMSFTYACLAGVALALALGTFESSRLNDESIALLLGAEVGLVSYLLLLHFSLLHAARFGSEGARKSAELLLKGALAGWFLGAVLFAGLGIPAAMIVLLPDGSAAILAVTACVLVGYYTYRVVIFKAGVYDPPPRFTVKLRRFS
jgi:sulfite dehydrogenase (quinone) subunit SoeC